MPKFNVVFEGCCHGSLDSIYHHVKSMKKPVDLVVIGGDFQAVRTHSDLQCMAVPPKYRQLGDFKKYYDREKVAPYLTIFIGGNHEASNYLQELYYGGWVAPNIYYLGASGSVIYKNSLRISGLSGIYQERDYTAPRTEKVPYNNHSLRSSYHIREYEVEKLKLLKDERVDLMLSHDWPAGIEHHGNLRELLQKKKYFKADIEKGELGSPPAMEILKTVKPKQWLSAHLHVRFTAEVTHNDDASGIKATTNSDEIELDLELLGNSSNQVTENTDEIVLDDLMEEEPEPTVQAANEEEIVLDELTGSIANSPKKDNSQKASSPVQTKEKKQGKKVVKTKFLALDKCLPRRSFLEHIIVHAPNLLETDSNKTSASPKKNKRARRRSSASSTDSNVRGYHADLSYDPEWLAITRLTNNAYPHQYHSDKSFPQSPSSLDTERAWVKENIVNKNLLAIPLNFKHEEIKRGRGGFSQPVRNNQTDAFCTLLGIENQVLKQQGPIPENNGSGPQQGKRSDKSGPSSPPKNQDKTQGPSDLQSSLPTSIPAKPAVPLPAATVVATGAATATAQEDGSFPGYEALSSDDNDDQPQQAAKSLVAPSTSTFQQPVYEANSSDSE